MRFLKRKPIGATWLGRPFLNKVNGGRFSIHQQEAAPFEIFHYVIAPSRSKLAFFGIKQCKRFNSSLTSFHEVHWASLLGI